MRITCGKCGVSFTSAEAFCLHGCAIGQYDREAEAKAKTNRDAMKLKGDAEAIAELEGEAS